MIIYETDQSIEKKEIWAGGESNARSLPCKGSVITTRPPARLFSYGNLINNNPAKSNIEANPI